MKILLFFIEIIIFCVIILSLSYFLGDRSNHSKNKNIPFESGVNSIGTTRVKFPIKFYLVSIFFIIFDMEAIYIYIWSIVLRETEWVGFIGSMYLIFFITIQLIFLVKRNFLMQKTKQYE